MLQYVMHDLIQRELLNLLPPHKKTSNKWISSNAVCCPYNSESADTRKRGGVLPNPDGSVTYHCFNCGFKTGFYPGRPMNFKFRKLLGWLGADSNTVQRLVMEALRIKELVPVEERAPAPEVEVTYKPRPLPADSASFTEWAQMLAEVEDFDMPDQLVAAVEYVNSRRIDTSKYNFYITDEPSYNLDKRLIVPFTWKNQIIGYTARALVDGIKPKYHNSHDGNYVFNMDQQLPDAKFVIVAEGPFDAMSIDGVAILGNECSETQAEIIESLGRDVIVVPDFDRHIDKKGREVWPGEMLVNKAIEYGWGVAFPVWRDDPECKDVSKAVEKYGKLFALKSILDSVERNPVKIRLRGKQ
jgi:hypothetical protein